MTTNSTTSPAAHQEGRGDGQTYPPGLWNLAFTELWERFSYYGLQGILTFYLLYSLDEGGLALSATVASSIVGAYGGSVYLSQIVGAWLGDRVLSPKHMVLGGAVVITLGHISLALLDGLSGLAVGLGLVVIGTGALKTNITTIVGMLYEGDLTRRDAGFSYFYMAINLGAVAGPLLTGLTQSTFGFHLAFGLAAVGMVGALVQYLFAMKLLPAAASVVRDPVDAVHAVRPSLIGLAAVATIAIAWRIDLINSENLANVVTGVVLLAATALFWTMLGSHEVTASEKRRVLGFLPLFVASGLYFGFLFQKFTTISILITDRVDLDVGGWEMPAAWITTASPLAAVLVTPLIARLWTRMGDRQPTAPTKFAIGLAQVGTAYLLLLLTLLMPEHGVSPFFMMAVMILAGSSEVLVGPIGLSLVTRIAPQRFKAQMVALIFLTLALGSSLSGVFGQLFSAIAPGLYFTLIGGGSVLLGAVLALGSRRIDHLIEGAR